MSTAEIVKPVRTHSTVAIGEYVEERLDEHFEDFIKNYQSTIKPDTHKSIYEILNRERPHNGKAKIFQFSSNDEFWSKVFCRSLESSNEMDKRADLIALNPFMKFIAKACEDSDGMITHVPQLNELYLKVNERIDYHLEASSNEQMGIKDSGLCRVVVTKQPTFDPQSSRVTGFDYVVSLMDANLQLIK